MYPLGAGDNPLVRGRVWCRAALRPLRGAPATGVGLTYGEQTVVAARDGRAHDDAMSGRGNVPLLELWTNGGRDYRNEQ
jgi:hypothetical protein